MCCPTERFERNTKGLAAPPFASSRKSAAGASMHPANRRHIAADHQEIATELVHQIELALARENAFARSGSGIPSSRETAGGDRRKAESLIRRPTAPGCRRTKQVVLENLHP